MVEQGRLSHRRPAITKSDISPAQRPRVPLGDSFSVGPTATPPRSVILIAYLALTISHADCPSCSRDHEPLIVSEVRAAGSGRASPPGSPFDFVVSIGGVMRRRHRGVVRDDRCRRVRSSSSAVACTDTARRWSSTGRCVVPLIATKVDGRRTSMAACSHRPALIGPASCRVRTMNPASRSREPSHLRRYRNRYPRRIIGSWK